MSKPEYDDDGRLASSCSTLRPSRGLHRPFEDHQSSHRHHQLRAGFEKTAARPRSVVVDALQPHDVLSTTMHSALTDDDRAFMSTRPMTSARDDDNDDDDDDEAVDSATCNTTSNTTPVNNGRLLYTYTLHYTSRRASISSSVIIVCLCSSLILPPTFTFCI